MKFFNLYNYILNENYLKKRYEYETRRRCSLQDNK